ncbi:MAG: redoxin domain-containing protein [Lacunisphaera sp.]
MIGVSHDDAAAQMAFKEKYHLPFTLLADTDSAVLKAFGVPNIPSTSLATRQAYLINKEGKIVWPTTRPRQTSRPKTCSLSWESSGSECPGLFCRAGSLTPPFCAR